jgi:hypothetical protein
MSFWHQRMEPMTDKLVQGPPESPFPGEGASILTRGGISADAASGGPDAANIRRCGEYG